MVCSTFRQGSDTVAPDWERRSATLALLIGDTERQRKIAEAVLHTCSHIELEGQESIWVLTGEGEASLLLGDTESAIRFYRSAINKTLPNETGIIQSMYHQLCRLHWALGKESVQPIVDLFESNGRLKNVEAGPFGDCRGMEKVKSDLPDRL